jgi:hypothetical protein
MFRYRTEIQDAGMPMPSYENTCVAGVADSANRDEAGDGCGRGCCQKQLSLLRPAHHFVKQSRAAVF